MIIQSRLKEYKVHIEQDFSFINKIAIDENSYFVVDKMVYDLYRDKIFDTIPETQLYLMEAIEVNKTIDTALDICEKMTAIPAKRNARLVSFGGGIVQDVTGFVANILYRGIHWTFIPTTLLAACDSCIGGKTSLNYKKFKNLLGTFYPPDEIFIYSEFFQTLSERDFQSGMGEVVKFNFMYGEKGLERIENQIDRLLCREIEVLNKFVESSLYFKKDFIEEDEFDKGRRIQLNFAHTFGHAFETMSNYEIPHGTAVAMGTIVANRISLSRGLLEKQIVLRMEDVLWKIIHVDVHPISVEMDVIMNAIRKDKKQISKSLTAVLMDANMKLQIVHDLQPAEMEPAIQYLFEHLKD